MKNKPCKSNLFPAEYRAMSKHNILREKHAHCSTNTGLLAPFVHLLHKNICNYVIKTNYGLKL